MIPGIDELLGPADERGRYLVADVGPVNLGFEFTDVVEVFPVARAVRVPWAPAWVHGAAYRSGRVVTLVDPARFLALEGACTPTVALLFERPDRALALLAASVRVVDARQASRTHAVQLYVREPTWLRASLSTPEVDFHLLDADALAGSITEAF
ncbi:MAG: chemotaxis protein CheW [Myxococcales bacterium]|nr:chemotaxis protein CheW [Myxococcales bacterium]